MQCSLVAHITIDEVMVDRTWISRENHRCRNSHRAGRQPGFKVWGLKNI